MAHYHERARVHTQPISAPRAPTHPGGSTRHIDCDTCPIAGRGCGDCMVALLGPVRFRLDPAEEQAVGELLDAGLITAQEAGAAYAVPEGLEDRVWPTPAADPPRGGRLRAIG